MPVPDEARWSHANPVRIRAGAGVLAELPGLLPAGRILVVTSPGARRRGLLDGLLAALPDRLTICDRISPNPDLDTLDGLIGESLGLGIAGVCAIGGGSAIDAAKALAACLPLGRERPLDAVLRNGSVSITSRLPLIACPTTAGTGSEVTPFATIWDCRDKRKHSLNDPLLFPDLALLDPTPTLTLPPDETLYSALDAVSHALESLWNRHCTPVSIAVAAQALALIEPALPAVLADPRDPVARARIQEASMLSGLAISQTRTAIAHSISYPLTSHFGVPHGLACSFTLPAIIERLTAAGRAVPLDQALLTRTYALLLRLDLPGRILRYTSAAECHRLTDMMSTPGRADNFILPVTPQDIETLVATALRR
jgi:phosphonate metabolism-associated iron-containing alcohol dehydrogenase